MKTIKSAFSEVTKVTTINTMPTMTKQALAEQLDVNNIIKRYNKTGILPQAQAFEAQYGEFNSYDLREAIEKVDKAAALFEAVPSQIRATFDNDAGAFIDYATNPANIQQMAKWGLANMPLPETKPDEKKA